MRWLVLLLLVVILGAGAWVMRAALQPIDYGIDASVFIDPGKATSPVEQLVQHLDQVASPRPNLIVILADDLGYGDVGVQGSRAIETPHIDRLASEGMRFTQFYSSAPLCSPSRAGLLTGRYPLRSGIITALPAADDSLLRRLSYRAGLIFAKLGAVDMPGGGNAVAGLPPSEITLPEALQLAGYRTMAIGKWHLGDFTALPEYHPSNHGFDRFVGFNMSNDDWPVAFWRDQTQVVADIGLDQARYTALFTEEAVRFIEDPQAEPFFLYLAHKDPHQPFYPGEAFAGRSPGGPYGDAVSEFDWSVGQVIAALRRADVAENTLVVVTSDNGPWFEGDPGGLRGRKGQSYEGGFRVPFVAWWPGRIPAGTVSREAGMNIDLFPTFLGLAGLALPSDRIVDGSSFSFDENVRMTRTVVAAARENGVSVEAEIGHVGSGKVIVERGKDESMLTDPEEARRFAQQTEIDCLAVSIGTAHGEYKAEPKIDFERLDAIRNQVPVPLVLHGGSGTGDENIARAVRGGIRKINLFTEFLNLYVSETLAYYRRNPLRLLLPSKKRDRQLAAIEPVLKRYFEISGSIHKGKA